MKNILLTILFITVTLSSCSSDSGGSNSNGNKITPPSWIQGTWAQRHGEAGDYYYINRYRFQSDDFCTLTSNVANCWKANVESYSNVQMYVNVAQVITDTEYKLDITIGSQILSYHFMKISNNKIESINSGSGFPSIQLTKQ